jgi:hypothetical protein
MKTKLTIATFLIVLTAGNVFAQYSPADATHSSQMVSMACIFEKGISEKADCEIYIYKNPDVQNVIKTFEGQKLGNTTLKTLSSGEGLPTGHPDIVFIGDKKNFEELLAYCNDNDVLTLTNIPSLVKKGVTLGMGVDGAGTPRLLINPDGVAEQGRNFNPAIMKIAKVFK